MSCFRGNEVPTGRRALRASFLPHSRGKRPSLRTRDLLAGIQSGTQARGAFAATRDRRPHSQGPMALSTGPLPGVASGPSPFLAQPLLVDYRASPPKPQPPCLGRCCPAAGLKASRPLPPSARNPSPRYPGDRPFTCLGQNCLVFTWPRPLVDQTAFSCSPGPAPSLT